jgi:hypothetical protein
MKTPPARIREIVRACRKYRRSLRRLECRYHPEYGAYIYTVDTARERSGSRGGYLVAAKSYTLVNLTPEQRERLVREIGVEPGFSAFVHIWTTIPPTNRQPTTP